MFRDRVLNFLANAASPETRDIEELKALYKEITGERNDCEKTTCIAKMLKAVRKWEALNEDEAPAIPEPRKYTLKPGNHAFVPGGPSVHNNDNTSDAAIEYYKEHFPHVAKLLI